MCNNDIKVSVIIPTFKRSNLLERAVRSAMNQTMKEIEIIVVDDNSPDSVERKETEKIMQQLQSEDSRIVYICHEKNRNGSAARNTGIKRASGEYLSFMDDDDYYLKDKLEKQYSTAKQLSQSYFGVLTNCLISRNGKIDHEEKTDSRENALRDVLACKYHNGSGSNMFVKREIALEIDGFDENLLRHQDYDFYARLFQKYDVFKMEEALFVVEYSSDISSFPNLQKNEKAKEYYLNKHKQLISSLPELDQKYIYFCNYYSLSEIAIKNRKIKSALSYLKKAKQFHAITMKNYFVLILKCAYAFVPRKIRNLIGIGRN